MILEATMTPTPQEPVIEEKNVFAPAMDAVDTMDGERIVISGMAGLYPDSESVKDFSEILYNKVNPLTEEGLRFKFNHPEVAQQSGSVPGLSTFDAQFFKVHYRLANCMDPMARKILEQSYQAIYDAGVNPDDLSGKKVGVYIGSCFSEAEKACFYEAASRFGFGIAGCSKTMFANRVSYWLNAKGPSMSIDEACCSSTAALEQAYLAISRGECEAAVVGGAFLCLHPQSSVHFGRIINLCQDGKTKSFDENADGCAKSEAINVLFLQKAKDALRIYADVLHVKLEFTGLLPGETGPRYGFYRDVDKTKNFIKTFYEEAKVPAQAIEYVEAFGCALPEVDKMELQAIEEVFCKDREDPLLVGSVMSNVGYNEAASGITAITKVLLGYHHGKLAANLHCGSPRQDVATLRDGRIRVVTEHEWFRRSLVAVNGLSVTGVNSHVLLNGHYKPKDPTRYKSSIPYLVTISGRHEAAVKFVLDNLKANPIDPEQLRLLHNAHQSKTAGHLGRGFTILQTDEEQKTVSLREQAEYFDDARRPLWFVYSGMGSQWAGMGTQLMRIPIFAAAIERCRKALEPKGLDIVDIITSTDEKTFDNILHSFVGIAAIQIGLTDILRELGLVPDGIIGHSVGELGCSYADGCLTAEEMILSAYSRGLVSLETPFIRGSMAAIGLGYEQISPMCPPEIQVACHNGPESSTISGPADKMREFVAELTEKGIFAKEVPCSNIAYHSRYIADAGPQLLKYLSEVIKDPKPRSERWLSTSVPEEKWDEPQAKLCSAEYHTNNLLSPVLFDETSRLIPNNAVLVEVAPHGLLQAILKRSLPSCKNIALTRRKHDDNAFLVLEAIGKLYMEGYNPKVHVLYPKVQLPVSTGTPFLSHLVKWAHDENWPLPLYCTANRHRTTICHYVTSLQDTDGAYLEGHSMRGHTLFPYAATLVLMWDVFCMTTGKPKKQLSVEFTDLHLISQPILHDQRQLRLNVSLQKGTGKFEVLNEDSRVLTGGIKIFEAQKLKPNYDSDTTLNIELTQDDIYRLMSERDYSYSGEFRSMEGCDSALSAAALAWRDNWVTFLDGLLQLNMLRQPHRAVTLPTHIRSISIDVDQHAKCVKQSSVSDFKVSLKADVSDQYNNTRCGGVIIHNIKYEKLPLLKNKNMVLKSLKINKENLREENYVSLVDSAPVSNVTLQCNQFGDFDSLTWVEAPENNEPGVKVKVHYAGISYNDTKKASGALSFRENVINDYGMDFSGTTENGDRVMGLVRGGAASSVVRAQSQLLWPVPVHWSLEDAATVPLAYAHAFYCLAIKLYKKLESHTTVLVHGGAGTLGQAVLSIVLAHGCQVYTTVSDIRKKRFLLKLFPGLKAENIGNSRDHSFRDMILNATAGKGCEIVISSVKGELKKSTLCCGGFDGVFLDISQLHNQEEDFDFGMFHLTKERAYTTVDFSTIFESENSSERNALQRMISEGIRVGYVRPLSRVTYAPHEAARAFRLQDGSRHRGRVLLRMHDDTLMAQPRLKCSADGCHLIISNDETFGLLLGDRLVQRGAKKLYLHLKSPSASYIQLKIRSWQKLGVKVEVMSYELSKESDISAVVSNAQRLGPVEGVYITLADNQQHIDETKLNTLDLVSRKLCKDIKYFAVLNTGTNTIGKDVILSRVHNNLPATMLSMEEINPVSNDERTCYRHVVELTEKTLCGASGVFLACNTPAQQTSLLQEITALAGTAIKEVKDKNTTLGELGVLNEKVKLVSQFLKLNYNLAFEETYIPSITVDRIQQLENSIINPEFKDEKGPLSAFFTYVDSDELLATTDFVFLPTLGNNSSMRDDEFDANQTYLCIVPGMEGHHERFRLLCERLKLPAIVLQPGLDRPNETVHETAKRFVDVFLKKTGLKNNFYLLGYETGIAIALEMVALLEDRGLTGTLYCIGFAPDELKVELDEQLSEFASEEELQNAVARHMFTLMAGGDARGLGGLQAARTWAQKVELCVRTLLGRVPHSAQYARALLETALSRIQRARAHVPRVRALRSRLVLLRAAAARPQPPARALQQHSERPLRVHQLTSPLAHATADLQCAAVINRYLHPDILQHFDNKNICDTYLLNANSFMTINDSVPKK
ncbi:fatty acid synthase-like [Helicoverpa zea]|uniref:fatty acid synthase-like n=1 Tax=Helicoverpa zea TaxID=7113 RepID=UPI001F58DDA3|nr:fatty acid synthase-like [Helicoverpa zea]